MACGFVAYIGDLGLQRRKGGPMFDPMKTAFASDLVTVIAGARVAPLAEFVGQTVGWLRVVTPITHHTQNYECAAWWQDEESATGIFPLILREDPYSKGKFYAVATLPAKVTDCYFGALWCGNPIGKYDKSADVGRDAEIRHRVNLPELVHTTGSATGKLDYAPVWSFVPSIIAHYKARAADWFESARQALTGESIWARHSEQEKFGSFGTYAIWAGEHAKAAEQMMRDLGYMTEKGDSWRELFSKNFDWIPE
jgi:hypothetical protein